MKKNKWTKKAKILSMIAATVLISVPTVAISSVACSSNKSNTNNQTISPQQQLNIQIANKIASYINSSQSHIPSIISAAIVSESNNNIQINQKVLLQYLQNYVANNLKTISINNQVINVNSSYVNLSNKSKLVYSNGVLGGIVIYYQNSDANAQVPISLKGFFNPNIQSLQMPLMSVISGVDNTIKTNQFYNQPSFQVSNPVSLKLDTFTNAENEPINISATVAANNPQIIHSIKSLGVSQIQNDLITVANSFVGLNSQMSKTKSLTAFTNVKVSQVQGNFSGHIYIQIKNITNQPQYINNWVSTLGFINLNQTTNYKSQMVQPNECFALNISFENAEIVPALANDGLSSYLSFKIEPNSDFSPSYVQYNAQIGVPSTSEHATVISSSNNLLGFNLGTKSYSLNTRVIGANSALNNQIAINNLYKQQISQHDLALGINNNWNRTWGLGFKLAPEIAIILEQLIGGPQGVNKQTQINSPIQGQTLYEFLTDTTVGNAIANMASDIAPNYPFLPALQQFIRNLFSSTVSMQTLVNSVKEAFPSNTNILAVVNGLSDVLESLISGAQQEVNAPASVKAMSFQQTNLWVLLNAVPKQVATLINSFIPVLSSDAVSSTLPPAVLIIFRGVIYIMQQLASNPSLSNLNGNIMNLHLFGFFTKPSTFQLIDNALNPSLLPSNQNPLNGLLYLIFKYYVFSKNPELNIIYSKIAQYLPEILENFINTPDFQINIQQLIINFLYPNVNDSPSTLSSYLSSFISQQQGSSSITTNSKNNPDISFNVWYRINSDDNLSINLNPLINLFSQSGYTVNSFLNFLLQNKFVNASYSEIQALAQNFGIVPLAYLLPENLDIAASDGLTFSYITKDMLVLYKENANNNGLTANIPVQNSIQMNYQSSFALMAKSIGQHIQKVLSYLTNSSSSPTQNQLALINKLKNISAIMSFASIFTNPMSNSVITYSNLINLSNITMNNVDGYSSQAASSIYPIMINAALSATVLNNAFNELNAQTNNYPTLSLATLNTLFKNFPKNTSYGISVVKGDYVGEITENSKLFLNPEYIVNIDFAVPYVIFLNGKYQLVQSFSFVLKANMQTNQFSINVLS